MGLTGATDLIDLRAMGTADSEDVIVRFIDRDMHFTRRARAVRIPGSYCPGASGGLKLSSAMAAPT